MSIPVERLIAIDEAKLGIFHGLEEPYITAYNKALREQIEAKNLVAAGALLTDFERRKAKFPRQEVLLNLATLFLFRHDENPYNYSPTMQQEKINLAKKDPELRSFFLRVGWGTIMQAEEKLAVWSETSEQDFTNYLANQTETRESSPTISQ